MKKTVLFLEPKGTILEVVRAAKARGYHVVALVSDPSMLKSAAMPYASALPLIDEIVEVDGWKNRSAIHALCASLERSLQIVGVYNGVDPCAVIAAELRARYRLPTTAASVYELVLDKFKLRKRLYAAGLSRLQNYASAEVEQWKKWPEGKAFYFKPVNGLGSAYVQRCESFDDLHRAIDAYRNPAGTDPGIVRDFVLAGNEYHLEEAIDGELLSVEAVCTGGKFRSIGLLSRILYSRNAVIELGAAFPYPHPLEKRITALVEQIHRELNFTDGPTHTEVIVSADGRIELIDFNARFVGTDMLQAINQAYQAPFEECLLDYALGLPARLPETVHQAACIQYILPPEVEVFLEVSMPQAPEVRFTHAMMKPGTHIRSRETQFDFVGCYLTVGPDFESSLARSKRLRNAVRINGSEPGVY